MAGFFFNSFSSNCLERLTINLKGAFHFYSVLIMAPVKNSPKKKRENETVPPQEDPIEFPVGALVWGRRQSSWLPGI